MTTILIVALALVAITVGYGTYAVKHSVEDRKVKRFLGMNVTAFALLMVGATLWLLSGNTALAADAATAVAGSSDGLRYMAAALSVGAASVGAGIAVSVSAAAAIGAISENPALLGKTIIFVGLSEGIAIYGLIVSIMILGN
ncbi:ATP synthase subunit C [Anaerotalea alkaliphila]|uniref:ATP synthase F(0) sector subunit c n=1 Tax=Anaerotalea alkaliphila TaxID=2662126 RepID=A0A7X5HU99_9FIRM|nr:ATP synthase subunit C [Anaerotalea alkaliphila]NDL66536.1 ATPase [Anaerotalea alkaliphila]